MTTNKLQTKLFPENGKWSYIISLEDGTKDGYFLCAGTRATKPQAAAMMDKDLEEYRQIYATRKQPA